MIICPRCETPNPPEAETCANCGRPLAIPPPRLLAQIQGLIPPEPIISTGQLKPGAEASWQQVGRILTQLGRPGDRETGRSGDRETGREGERPPLRLPAPPRWLALLLLLAILLGLVVPPLAPAPSPVRPGVETAFHLIDILPPGARVLLAWDYEPTTQGEMQLLAQPILQHLQQQQALLADVSLRPLGPAVAADARLLTASLRPPGIAVAGPPPVELGFIPGNAAALQALAIAPASAANLPDEGIQALDIDDGDGIDAFDLIIEFSAESAASREWVEQIAARQRTPLLIAASGAIAPTLEPYVQSGQLAALLAGYPDALAYENLIGQDGPATAEQTAQTLAHLLFIVVVLLSLTLPLFRRQRR